MNLLKLVLLLLSVTASAANDSLHAGEINGFRLDGALVPESEILSGGPPRDGIPAIDRPRFISGKKALELYSESARAIVVRVDTIVKAYPVPVLNWHEIVNDRVAGRPLTVTYCPLCGSGIVFEAGVGGKALDFGVSGLLYQSDMLLYDRETNSLWSQLMRKAISGKHQGKKLAVYPSRMLPLREIVRETPSVQVLLTDTGHRRRYSRDPYDGYEETTRLYFPVRHRQDDATHPKTWSILLESGDHAVIVPLSALDAAKREQELLIGDRPVVLAYDAESKLINCKSEVEAVTCLGGYYFALRAFYPEAKVYRAGSKG